MIANEEVIADQNVIAEEAAVVEEEPFEDFDDDDNEAEIVVEEFEPADDPAPHVEESVEMDAVVEWDDDDDEGIVDEGDEGDVHAEEADHQEIEGEGDDEADGEDDDDDIAGMFDDDDDDETVEQPMNGSSSHTQEDHPFPAFNGRAFSEVLSAIDNAGGEHAAADVAEPAQLAMEDVRRFIDPGLERKVFKKIFGKNKAEYEAALDRVNAAPTWRAASQVLDEIFIRFDVDPYSRTAIRFTDSVYGRYLPANR